MARAGKGRRIRAKITPFGIDILKTSRGLFQMVGVLRLRKPLMKVIGITRSGGQRVLGVQDGGAGFVDGIIVAFFRGRGRPRHTSREIPGRVIVVL
jgi:hypothetical protein